MKALYLATQEYLNRRARATHPAGTFLQEERAFTPDTSEIRACCKDINPAMRYNHCRSLVHVAALFGVRPEDLRKNIRKIRRANELSTHTG